MKVIITQWALDSYLNLRSNHIFGAEEYRIVIRPDVMLLAKYPDNPKFAQGKFWSLAQDCASRVIANGFKMKWHQIGTGRVQLRLTVGIFSDVCLLCEAYVKINDKQDKRQLARFKTYLQLIRQERYSVRGRLS